MEENNKIPKHWQIKKFGEIASYINGKAFKTYEWSRKGLPIIRIQNLNRKISEYNYCNFPVEDKYHVDKGDLLFAWSGTPETSFGAHIWKGEKAVLNQHIFRIVLNEKFVDKKYYLQLLTTN
jgi:type I restriction enzyme S subunit